MNTVQGRTFDWKSHHDPRSRAFSAAAATPPQVRLPKSRLWAPPDLVLNQGAEGHCVGFGCAAEAAASPVRIPNVNNAFGHALFYAAQAEDRKMGNIWDDGASVLAGVKGMQALKLLSGEPGSYRWAFSPDEMRKAVLGLGPAVIGVPYRTNMFEPRPSGLVDIGGANAGGHCMCVLGFHPSMRLKGESWRQRFAVYKVRQSWGEGFGKHGDIYIREEDMAELTSAANQGEVCIPLRRLTLRTSLSMI